MPTRFDEGPLDAVEDAEWAKADRDQQRYWVQKALQDIVTCLHAMQPSPPLVSRRTWQRLEEFLQRPN